MGFRINRGIFQFKDAATETFINKFKIDDRDGSLVEVDSDGNAVTGYLKVGETATNSDKVDGYHANNSGGGIPVLNSNGYWNSPSWINVYAHGIYSSNTNGAHFYPNSESYGAWRITGTRNGWYGIHFGGSTGVALMMNESESGVHRQGSGWKYRHQGGKFYVYTGTNGGGTGYAVIHEGTIGSQSVNYATSSGNADTVDGSHRHEMGNREFTKQGFYVDGDENTYYPVVFAPRNGYAFNRWSISRRYNWTAPYDPIGTGSHKAGLTFDFYWAADTAWGGNDKSIRIHQFSEQYTTTVGGIKLARTGGVVVWLRGGHAYYELQTDNSQTSITPYYDTWTDGSGVTYSPTGDANEYRDTIWNNYPVRNSGELFLSNRKVATEQWTDDTFLRTTEKAADSNLLDGLNSTQFLRSDANDTKTGDTIFTGKVTLQTNLVITEDAPTISFLDTSSEDDFYIHVNSNNFYVLRNTANSENTVDGGWDSPHPLQLEGDTNKAYIFGNLIGTAAYQASSAFDASGTAQTIVDTAKEELLNGAIATAQTTADNAATAASNAQTTANTALARANGAREDTVAIGELATAAQAAADAAQATADGKLGATAKAADSDKLDGLNSTQFLRSDTSDTMSGDLTISNGRITIKRGTGLTHAEWEDDSTAGGRSQLILDSHYSDLIIASRNSNNNKHGSTLTFATQSTSTNDVAKWVIGQGQYQEGANHLAFAYGTNQTNPHGILGTDNAYADFVIMDGRMVCIGGTVDKQAYSATGSTRLMFGGANTDAQSNYYIGTNMEDYGGNYTKLDLRWHTGIRMGAQAGYGGIRFYDSEDLGSVIFSVGQGDANVRVSNSLYVLGSSNSGRLYSDDWGIKVGTDNGHIQFGPANNDWAHIYTDRPNFYFNKNIYVSGAILSTRSWAQGVADTAESNATAAANARIDDELVPQITANTDAITNNRNEITTVAAAAAAAQSTADGKLGATAKAADSNLLDGLDSGAFIRSNADDNVSGNTEWQDNKQVRLGNGADFRMWHDGSHTYFRNYNHGTGNFYWQGEDTEGTNHALLYMINDVSEPYIKFYANGGEKLRTTTGGITVYGSITVDGNVSANQVFMQSITSDGTIANDKGSYLHLGGWAVGRTDASAVLVNTAYRADYATSLFDMNISRFTNNSGYITQSSIDTFAEELRGEIQTAQTTADNAATAAATAQTTADGKLGATAKAADADKLDGYDWMQSGKSVRANEFYADNWFRNYNSNEGLYNQATGQHWYSDDDDYWNIAGGTAANGIRFRDEHAGTIRGYVYATSNNEVGFLDSDGSWAVRVVRDSHVELRDNNEVVFTAGQGGHSSNYGTVCTHGNGRGGWEGYSINGWWVFMSSDGSNSGIYNDVDNEWMTRWHRNGATELMHNGSTKLTTTSGGVSVTGSVSATSFSGDGSALTNLNVPDQSIPVSINGEGGNILLSMNMNLDRGQIEFTLSNGQTFTAQMGR